MTGRSEVSGLFGDYQSTDLFPVNQLFPGNLRRTFFSSSTRTVIGPDQCEEEEILSGYQWRRCAGRIEETALWAG